MRPQNQPKKKVKAKPTATLFIPSVFMCRIIVVEALFGTRIFFHELVIAEDGGDAVRVGGRDL